MTDGRLGGCGSGEGSDTDLGPLTDLSVRRSVEFVCLCAANGTRQQPHATLPLSSRRGGVKNTHEIHNGQHDVIQFCGAMDVLPTTAQTEYCIRQFYTIFDVFIYVEQIVHLCHQILCHLYCCLCNFW